MSEVTAQAPQEKPEENMCACGHRRRFHEGKFVDCVIAGCPCRTFVKAAPAEAEELQ